MPFLERSTNLCKFKIKYNLEDAGVHGMIILRWVLNKRDVKFVDLSQLGQGSLPIVVDKGNEASDHIKEEECTGKISKCQFLKSDSVPWNLSHVCKFYLYKL
jgi:hypothetical protein